MNYFCFYIISSKNGLLQMPEATNISNRTSSPLVKAVLGDFTSAAATKFVKDDSTKDYEMMDSEGVSDSDVKSQKELSQKTLPNSLLRQYFKLIEVQLQKIIDAGRHAARN